MNLMISDHSENIKHLKEAIGKEAENFLIKGIAKALHPIEEKIKLFLLDNNLEGEVGFSISAFSDSCDCISIETYYAPLETSGLWFVLGKPFFEFQFPFNFIITNPENVKNGGKTLEEIAFNNCYQEVSKIMSEGFSILFRQVVRRLKWALEYRYEDKLSFFYLSVTEIYN